MEKLQTGDMKFQLPGLEKELALNPAVLEPVIPKESRQAEDAIKTIRIEATGLP